MKSFTVSCFLAALFAIMFIGCGKGSSSDEKKFSPDEAKNALQKPSMVPPAPPPGGPPKP